jgi:thioredoxin 1
MGERLRVIKVDVDKNPQAAMHYRVQGVPTLVLFKKGQQLWRRSGALSAAQLSSAIEPLI